MKKILISICLFTVWITSYSQINCNGTSASTVNPTDKLAICNGNLQRTVTASQLVDAAIDTTKVGRIEQGRGTAPIFMYFNGVAWVRNDTSYVPASGSNKMNGAYLNKISGTQTFGVEYPNANPLLNVDAKLTFSENGMIFNQQKNESVITGNYNIDPSTQNPKVEFRSRIAAAPNTDGSNIYFGLYAKDDGTGKIIANGSKVVGNKVYRDNDTARYIQLKDAEERFAPTSGTQSTALADGKIWIGDGTDTAFPRTLSGDVTINNLGEATVDSINGITKSYYDPTSSIQTQLNNKQNTLTDANFATFVNSTTNKTTPVDADIVPIVDVSTGKRFSLSNLWTNWLVNKIQTTALTISVAWERRGVANNSSAASGYIGEVLRASGSGVSIVSSTTTAIGSLSLPPGNYQVEGTVTFIPAGGASLGTQACSVSETSANIGLGEGANIRRTSGAAYTSDGDTIPTGTLEVKKSTTGNVFINGYLQFTGGTVSCIWTIKALRVR